MKHTIILILLTVFLISPVYALTEKQEADIALTDKLVQSQEANRELTADIEHLEQGNKFYWFVIGAFLYQAINQPDNDTKGHKHHHRR